MSFNFLTPPSLPPRRARHLHHLSSAGCLLQVGGPQDLCGACGLQQHFAGAPGLPCLPAATCREAARRRCLSLSPSRSLHALTSLLSACFTFLSSLFDSFSQALLPYHFTFSWAAPRKCSLKQVCNSPWGCPLCAPVYFWSQCAIYHTSTTCHIYSKDHVMHKYWKDDMVIFEYLPVFMSL